MAQQLHRNRQLSIFPVPYQYLPLALPFHIGHLHTLHDQALCFKLSSLVLPVPLDLPAFDSDHLKNRGPLAPLRPAPVSHSQQHDDLRLHYGAKGVR
jgi:hypothetical protein